MLAASHAPAASAVPVIKQPTQPTAGPGGSQYPHTGVQVTTVDALSQDGYDVFEPTGPKPAKAPVIVMLHGNGITTYDQMRGFIWHTVRKGSIVIYPKYQSAPWAPCLGSINIDKCVKAAVNGVVGGLNSLRSDPARVQPDTDKTSYFGYSLGGIVAINMVNRWASLGVPKPRVLLVDDPHDGALLSKFELGMDADLSGIPSDILLQCQTGQEGVTATKPGASCNALFPRLGHIPESQKDIVMLYSDAHGQPPLVADHWGASTSSILFNKVTAYDYHYVWKVMDALQSCAFEGRDCQYALGDTPEHRFNGLWSDGVPVKPLKIQHAAPIVP